MSERTDYIIVTSPENWAKTAEHGWQLLGLKSTRTGQAAKIKPGDRVIAYATGRKRFLAALEVTSELFIDHTPVWGSAKKPGEDYPHRFQTRPLIVLAEDEQLDAFAVARRLEFTKRWGEHISLAFQGNIRPIPTGDFDLIYAEMEQARRALAS
jgi:predicted RNA-binding protein